MDRTLAAAGLLSKKMFGSSVMPPQPPGIWAVVYSDDRWETSAGEDRYRRGLYTFIRRTSAYPMNLNFDSRGRLWVTHSVEYPFAASDPAQARDGVTICDR
mgnify:CR=1 FL=1